MRARCCISSVHEIVAKAPSFIQVPAVLTLLAGGWFRSALLFQTEKIIPSFSLKITTVQRDSRLKEGYHDASV